MGGDKDRLPEVSADIWGMPGPGVRLLFFFLALLPAACGILAHGPGMELWVGGGGRKGDGEAQSPNHWTTREFPELPLKEFYRQLYTPGWKKARLAARKKGRV